MRKSDRPLLALASLALLVAACASGGTEPPAAAPEAASQHLPNDVRWVRSSAEHEAAFIQTYALAAARLEELVAGRAPGSWAVALDADETVIDNSQYEKELAEGTGGHTAQKWAAWVARREAPPLPGALAFLARVQELGGRIAIVTNRGEPLCPATEEDFRRYSIPFDVILCRPEGAPPDKEPRWQRVEEGTAAAGLPPLDIVLWIGDNIGDFPELDQELRRAPEAAFADFGRRFFVVPNPMYGSWMGNPEE